MEDLQFSNYNTAFDDIGMFFDFASHNLDQFTYTPKVTSSAEDEEFKWGFDNMNSESVSTPADDTTSLSNKSQSSSILNLSKKIKRSPKKSYYTPKKVSTAHIKGTP